ncbi:cupin domain-containing protein [Arvimicrobium flavum]|uniref:cupin domain-containing protein n=1 Tax=Arvimicrobium flavum TaxID=3393320 RepID=UPI00237B8193|nr:cupin domain-containing protein [Mesorhizobium shangrilense]
MSSPQLHHFRPSNGMPNNNLPLIVWKGGLPVEARNGQAACALYQMNGWGGTWVYTVYPFWHFHAKGHEVLSCVSGTARIGFGGDDGIVADVSVGDVAIVPAGVGHKKLSASPGFQMAGGYPPGQQGDIVRPGEMSDAEIAAAIGKLALPETDPISGKEDGVVEFWRRAAG